MRGRKEKIPGLQAAIEECLAKHAGQHVSTKEIQTIILAELELKDLEREEVVGNIANYILRANKHGVLISQGRRKGYLVNADF